MRCKANKQWVWLALCRRTRQVVAYAVGDRSEVTCRRLWDRLPPAFRHGLCFTDFWRAYALVVPAAQHVAGGKETGQTNHVERFNNTLRQRLARFVRDTLSARGVRCTRSACTCSCTTTTASRRHGITTGFRPLPWYSALLGYNNPLPASAASPHVPTPRPAPVAILTLNHTSKENTTWPTRRTQPPH